jgi:hypothetical protein
VFDDVVDNCTEPSGFEPESLHVGPSDTGWVVCRLRIARVEGMRDQVWVGERAVIRPSLLLNAKLATGIPRFPIMSLFLALFELLVPCYPLDCSLLLFFLCQSYLNVVVRDGLRLVPLTSNVKKPREGEKAVQGKSSDLSETGLRRRRASRR